MSNKTERGRREKGKRRECLPDWHTPHSCLAVRLRVDREAILDIIYEVFEIYYR